MSLPKPSYLGKVTLEWTCPECGSHHDEYVEMERLHWAVRHAKLYEGGIASGTELRASFYGICVDCGEHHEMDVFDGSLG